MSEIAWYYALNNQQMGPVPQSKLQQMLDAGEIPPKALVWSAKLKDWTPALDVADLKTKPAPLQEAPAPSSPIIQPGAQVAAEPAVAMGPRGKIRNPWAVVGLTIITIGIYAVVWYYKLWDEASNYGNGRNGVRIRRGRSAFLLYAVCPAILFLFGMVLGTVISEAANDEMAIGLSMLFFFLPMLVLIIIGQTHTPGLIRKMRRALGYPADRLGHPGLIVLLSLIPYAGGILYLVATQKAMNKFWREEAV